MAVQISTQPVAKEKLKNLIADCIIDVHNETNGGFLLTFSMIREIVRERDVVCSEEEIYQTAMEIIESDYVGVCAINAKLKENDLTGNRDRRVFPTCTYLLFKKSDTQEVSSTLPATTYRKLKHIAVSRGMDLSEHIKDELERSIERYEKTNGKIFLPD